MQVNYAAIEARFKAIPPPDKMHQSHILRLEAVILELQARAKHCRSDAKLESIAHGETSLQAQKYAGEACAYEHSVRSIEQAMALIKKAEETITSTPPTH